MLPGDRYRSGTGSGSGELVRNNSRKIYCDCLGDDDYLYYEQRGELVHSGNNNASVRLT